MHVLYPNDLQARRQQRVKLQQKHRRRRQRTRFSSLFMAFVLLVAGLGVVGYIQPIEAAQPSLVAIQSETIAPLSLPWPAKGQAAVGGVGHGVVDQRGTEKPAPIASTAKIVTALVVLEAKPLQPGQQGPNITFTAQDEAIYDSYISRGGSVYPVTAGESISQRQALEALLIMSANNIADLLAVWAYGSMDAYVVAANQYAQQHGFENMTISDASGFSPKTTATAEDLVLAGEELMQQPLLRSIIAQRSLIIPGIGEVPSTNVLLGGDIVGIKTGNTDEAGGCYVIALNHKISDGETVTVVAAVMGADDVPAAMGAARALVQDARNGFALKTVVSSGDIVARYTLPWGGEFDVVVEEDLRVVSWLPAMVEPKVDMVEIDGGVVSGQELGSISTASGESVRLIAQSAAVGPSHLWRAYTRYF